MEVKTMRQKLLTTLVCATLILTTLLGLSGFAGAAAPSTPQRPNGPDEGSHHVLYEFSVRPVYDPESDNVFYWFDWGDGQNTGWLGPYPSGTGPIKASHQWTANGVYPVKVKAKDIGDNPTPFGPSRNITIVNLETPDMPQADDDEAGIGELVEFWVPAVQAPYAHDVLYLFDWDEDNLTTSWIGPYPSGYQFPIEASHNWEEKGTYQVRVKAKDNTTADESAWSPPFNITVGVEGPQFAIVGCTGGFGVTVSIRNMLAPSKYVDYTIDVAGGQLTGMHVHKYYNGTVYIKSGTTEVITVPAFFALGKTKISVTARCAGVEVAEQDYECFVLFFYVMRVTPVE